MSFAEKVDYLLNEIFLIAQDINRQLKAKISFDRALVMADIKQHLQRLLADGFMTKATMEWLCHYPRHLRPIQLRLEKLSSQLNWDQALIEG